MPICSVCSKEIVPGKGFSYPYMPDDDPFLSEFRGKYFCSDRCNKKFTEQVKSKFRS